MSFTASTPILAYLLVFEPKSPSFLLSPAWASVLFCSALRSSCSFLLASAEFLPKSATALLYSFWASVTAFFAVTNALISSLIFLKRLEISSPRRFSSCSSIFLINSPIFAFSSILLASLSFSCKIVLNFSKLLEATAFMSVKIFAH